MQVCSRTCAMRADRRKKSKNRDLLYARCWLELRLGQTQKRMRSKATLPIYSYMGILSRPGGKVNGHFKLVI